MRLVEKLLDGEPAAPRVAKQTAERGYIDTHSTPQRGALHQTSVIGGKQRKYVGVSDDRYVLGPRSHSRMRAFSRVMSLLHMFSRDLVYVKEPLDKELFPASPTRWVS